MAKLELNKIVKVFDTTRVVNQLSLTINEGEFVSLLGPSGCGKTTTLNMIAGFLQPDGGEIRIGGQNVTDLPPFRRNTGMVFQNYALFPHMTVAQNVAFGLKMRKVPAADIAPRVQKALDLVRLPHTGDRYPRQLSGGQQQRIAIARALVIEPEILLLDEPLSNLDAKLREQMRIELREIQRRVGITTVFVTHDQAEALQCPTAWRSCTAASSCRWALPWRSTTGRQTSSWRISLEAPTWWKVNSSVRRGHTPK